MSQPSSYRMNGLAEPGSFLREGLGEGSADRSGSALSPAAVRQTGGAQRVSPALSLAEALSPPSFAAAVAASPSSQSAGFLARQAASLGQPALSPSLRGGSVAPFAVRNNLRTPPLDPTLVSLQRWLGITFLAMAWLVFLWGMAHLVIAAVHNGEGELGASIDATVRGSKCCLGAFLLTLVGLPQWLVAQRKLERARLLHN